MGYSEEHLVVGRDLQLQLKSWKSYHYWNPGLKAGRLQVEAVVQERTYVQVQEGNRGNMPACRKVVGAEWQEAH